MSRFFCTFGNYFRTYASKAQRTCSAVPRSVHKVHGWALSPVCRARSCSRSRPRDGRARTPPSGHHDRGACAGRTLAPGWTRPPTRDAASARSRSASRPAHHAAPRRHHAPPPAPPPARAALARRPRAPRLRRAHLSHLTRPDRRRAGGALARTHGRWSRSRAPSARRPAVGGAPGPAARGDDPGSAAVPGPARAVARHRRPPRIHAPRVGSRAGASARRRGCYSSPFTPRSW